MADHDAGRAEVREHLIDQRALLGIGVEAGPAVPQRTVRTEDQTVAELEHGPRQLDGLLRLGRAGRRPVVGQLIHRDNLLGVAHLRSQHAELEQPLLRRHEASKLAHRNSVDLVRLELEQQRRQPAVDEDHVVDDDHDLLGEQPAPEGPVG